jgi:dihydroorotate dehydrogenase (fumarate)
MLEQIQDLRAELKDTDPNAVCVRVGVELNTSCPNIPNAPPPAYDPQRLKPLLDVLALHWEKDSTLVLGLKLAPFVYRLQQAQLVDLIASYTTPDGRIPLRSLRVRTLSGIA